jgi:S-adenosylmethionine hydrolase
MLQGLPSDPMISDTSIVALLTDFGWQDAYVGILKGVIAQINPRLPVIDITHGIPPQNLAAARFCLMQAYPYFPAGTILVAVVDPGVGSQRRGIALQFPGGYLVGPDNGVFGGVLSQSPANAAVSLTNTTYWRSSQVSSTFHGRDIFAPVAAHLASGVPLYCLGEPIDPNHLSQLPLPEAIAVGEGIVGCIQYIDSFGNLITNIPAATVAGKAWSVRLGEILITSRQTYSEADNGEAIALIGSHGWVEIAVNQGNAQSQFQSAVGTQVSVFS